MELKCEFDGGAMMDFYRSGGGLPDDLEEQLKAPNCNIEHPRNWDYFDWVNYCDNGIFKVKL